MNSDSTGDRSAVQPVAGPIIEVWWLETGNEQLLGELPVTVDESLMAHFSGNIMVPANAAPGANDVGFMISGGTDPACLPFTVTQSVQADAYPLIAALPSTGLKSLLPATGMVLAAAGMALIGRRRPLT